MGLGYDYTLEPRENGWSLVRFPGFPGFPEALTEGETEAEARDCLIAAIVGCRNALARR